MERYKIRFQNSVRKDLKKIRSEYVLKILEKINELSKNPRPKNSKKLKAVELYRLRIGVYRVIYEIHENELIISIVKVGHRSKIFKN